MCTCTTEVNTNWEPESINLFAQFALARYPMNDRTKDAFDGLIKMIKDAAKPSSIMLTGDGTDSLSDSALVGRTPKVIAIDDVFKMTGFQKAGSTDAERLASNTIEFLDGTPASGAKIYIGF